MNWHSYVTQLAVETDGSPVLQPAGPPADPATLAAIEAALRLRLPADLRALYDAMNGVYDPQAYWNPIFPADELIQENSRLRELKIRDPGLYKLDFAGYLFFGGRGNGDLFAFPVNNGIAQADRIVYWDHETGEITTIASSLENLLRWWVRPTAE